MPKTQPSNFRDSERQQENKRTYLYVFQYGDEFFYLTNYDRDIVVDSLPPELGDDPETFISCGVGNDALEQSYELNSPKCNVTITINDSEASRELKRHFLLAVAKQLKVTIIQVSGDSLPGPVDYDDNLFVTFVGIKTSIGFVGNTIVMPCINPALNDDSKIPTFTYTKPCQYIFGSGVGCPIDPEGADISMTVEVTAIDRINRWIEIAETQINGNDITGDVTFETGICVELDGSDVVSRIGIVANSEADPGPGTRFYLHYWSQTLHVGTQVRLYRGCRRTVAHCTQFGALADYGGHPYIPTTNPALDGVTA